jgi:hypothetical protein
MIVKRGIYSEWQFFPGLINNLERTCHKKAHSHDWRASDCLKNVVAILARTRNTLLKTNYKKQYDLQKEKGMVARARRHHC